MPAQFQVIGADDVPEYPIPAGERLQSHYFFNMHHARWLASKFRMLADLDVRGVGIDLVCLSQNEAPVGTLPTDERLLARLCGLDLETWRKLAQREIPPLYGWTLCRCGDEIRLMHPVVLEIAQAAVGSKHKALENAAMRRDAKRLKDLREKVDAVGAAQVLRGAGVLDRLDAWLLENHTGNRTDTAVRRALDAVCG